MFFVVCFRHRDVYFKYDWSIPLTSLSMHKKGESSFAVTLLVVKLMILATFNDDLSIVIDF